MSFNADKVEALMRSWADKVRGTKRIVDDQNPPTDRSTRLPSSLQFPPAHTLSSPCAEGQETSVRYTSNIDEDVKAIAEAIDQKLIEEMKERSSVHLHRAFSVGMRRVLAMERALVESLETTSKGYAEVIEISADFKKENDELKKSLSAKEAALSSMQEEYERKLDDRGREAVETFKTSAEFDEIASMFGVKCMIHAYKKVKEWLSNGHPEIDLDEFEGFAQAEALDDDDDHDGEASN